MRIAYLHQYFTSPELGGGTRSYEFATRWVGAGHEVHVLRIGEHLGPSSTAWRVDVIEGVHVHTLDLKYSNEMGFVRRLGAFAGYALAATRRLPKISPDAVYATSTPLTVALPALASRLLRRTPFVFEVRDLWPDVPIALGYLSNPILRAAALWLERSAYRKASHVVALAPGMKADIEAKGIPGDKISVIPQGCDTRLFEGADPDRARESLPELGDGRVYLYAGAIGQANGLRYLIDLATEMEPIDHGARFVIVGEGKERKELEQLAADRGLLDRSVFFLGALNKHQVADWMAAATATLALLTGPRVLWKDAVQNKFFDSLAAGRPIATNNDGWQTQIAVESGVGIMLDPEDPAHAANQLLEMANDRQFMDRVPDNCRELAASRFNREAQAEEALRLVVAAGEER